MRVFLALRVFFLVLFSGESARKVRAALEGPSPVTQPVAKATPTGITATPPATPPAETKPKAKPASARSEAITLLSTLQREARLVDFLQEKLDGYSDAQIGAAARDVHRESARVLERLFALRPLASETEGAQVEVSAGFDPGRFQLIGNVSGTSPYRGHVIHTGWIATRCEMPVWSGSDASARVISATEVELK